MIQISEAEYERLKKLAGISHCELPASPKLGPIRPVSDPPLELTREYVERMGCRHAHSIEARLMRDWLRMHRQITEATPAGR